MLFTLTKRQKYAILIPKSITDDRVHLFFKCMRKVRTPLVPCRPSIVGNTHLHKGDFMYGKVPQRLYSFCIAKLKVKSVGMSKILSLSKENRLPYSNIWQHIFVVNPMWRKSSLGSISLRQVNIFT